MDVVRWLSLVLFGFFWIGLIVVYELSLFDKELTSLLAQYARYDAAQSEAIPAVVLMTQGQGWGQVDRSDAAADFWMDVAGSDQQNQRVIKDSRPVLRQPKSRFERFSKARYLSQKRKLGTLGRLNSLLSRSTRQEVRRQKSQLEALKVNYNGSEWKSGVRALDRLERTVFQELARLNLIEPDIKEMVMSADELLALVAKQPAMQTQFTRMFYSTKRMRVRAILMVLTRQRQQRQLRHLRRQASKQRVSPLINSRPHMSEEASQHFRKHIKPVLDEGLVREQKAQDDDHVQYDYVSKDGSIKIKYLKSTSEEPKSERSKSKEPKSKEMVAWLKNKYLAAAKYNKQDPPREQEALDENSVYGSEEEGQAEDVPQVQKEQLGEEEANSNYAYDLKVDIKDGKIKAVPASGFVDEEALHARMLEQRGREMQRKRKAHEEKLRAGESRDKSSEAEKTSGFKAVRTAKDTLKDYDYAY